MKNDGFVFLFCACRIIKHFKKNLLQRFKIFQNFKNCCVKFRHISI